MAQRFSGRVRRSAEFYPTPPWVTLTLLDWLPDAAIPRTIWEPACGDGDMVVAMRKAGRIVVASDLRAPGSALPHAGTAAKFMDASPLDFLTCGKTFSGPFGRAIDDIVTNPPYGIQGRAAEEFIKVALSITEQRRGRVAMLLKADFDSGKSRTPLFRDCPAWSRKVVLLTRILWFEAAPNAKGQRFGPSENHAWYIWDWEHSGPATVVYDDGLRYGAKEWKGVAA